MDQTTLGMVLIVLVGTSCSSVPVQDGRISTDRVAEVQPIAGKFSGTLRLRTTDGRIDQFIQDGVKLELGLQKDLLVLTSSSDLVGVGCQSHVGVLKSLSIWKDEGSKVIQGYFALEPNKCRDEIESTQLLFIARYDEKNPNDTPVLLETFIIKDYVRTRSAAQGKRPLNIHGTLARTK